MPSYNYYPRNCLAYHLERPLLQTKAIDKAMCADVAKLMVEFQQTHPSQPYPEAEALEFYQLAHAFALIQHRRHPHEPVPADELKLVEEYEYFSSGSRIAQRAFFYLLVICARWSRYLKNKSAIGPTVGSRG